MKKTALLILCALVFTAACSSSPAVTSQPPASVSGVPASTPQQYLITESIDSECLKDNLINVSPEKGLYIYLPPSYYDSDKAYPVVYYLHGYGEPAGSYIRASKPPLDNAFKEGADEFIFVGIDGGLSFYVNSPITGNWEDYFLTEIIPYVDANYKTIPDVSSRGICGFSMGGFGCINLALKHPDIFCAVYSMSPGLLNDDGLPEAMDSWRIDSGFLRTYAQAFAPNENAEKLGDIPAMDGSEEDNIIVEKWMSGFGDLEEKMYAYIALGIPLKAIGFSYGTRDTYKWIPEGTQCFSDMLKENGIENELYVFNGGHTQPVGGMTELLIPFFNENLVYED
jgi:S-formylglutathione hydrolase FrmB